MDYVKERFRQEQEKNKFFIDVFLFAIPLVKLVTIFTNKTQDTEQLVIDTIFTCSLGCLGLSNFIILFMQNRESIQVVMLIAIQILWEIATLFSKDHNYWVFISLIVLLDLKFFQTTLYVKQKYLERQYLMLRTLILALRVTKYLNNDVIQTETNESVLAFELSVFSLLIFVNFLFYACQDTISQRIEYNREVLREFRQTLKKNTTVLLGNLSEEQIKEQKIQFQINKQEILRINDFQSQNKKEQEFKNSQKSINVNEPILGIQSRNLSINKDLKINFGFSFLQMVDIYPYGAAIFDNSLNIVASNEEICSIMGSKEKFLLQNLIFSIRVWRNIENKKIIKYEKGRLKQKKRSNSINKSRKKQRETWDCNILRKSSDSDLGDQGQVKTNQFIGNESDEMQLLDFLQSSNERIQQSNTVLIKDDSFQMDMLEDCKLEVYTSLFTLDGLITNIGGKDKEVQINVISKEAIYGKQQKARQITLILIEDISSKIEMISEHENNQFKVKLINSFTHQLRTPLNYSLNKLRQLLKDSSLNQNQITTIRPVYRSNKLLSYIIADFLDFAQIENDNLMVNPKIFCPYKKIKKCFDLFHVPRISQNLNFSLECSESLKQYTLLNDCQRFKQVIMNLLSNAVKFTKNGRIVVQILLDNNGEESGGSNISSKEDDKENEEKKNSKQIPTNQNIFASRNRKPYSHLTFKVKDDGIGMTKEQIDLVKNSQSKFLKSSYVNSDLNNTQGIGFGLIIVNQLVQIIGNQGLEIFSVPGQGAQFTFQVAKDLNALKEGRQPSIIKRRTKILSTLFQRGGNQSNSMQTRQEYKDQVNQVNYPKDSVIEIKEISDQISNEYLIEESSYSREELQNYIQAPRNQNNLKERNLNSHHQGDKVEELSNEQNEEYDYDLLVVDDNYFNVEAFVYVTESIGYQIETAFSGQEAVKKVSLQLESNSNYQVIFMDLDMPVKDGFMTTKEILNIYQTQYPYMQPPTIICCSAFNDSNSINKALESGMIDYIKQPINENAIKTKLKAYYKL